MIWLACYIATVYAANWAVKEFGFVSPWFLLGLSAPAGVYFAGLAFTFRDLTHRSLGRWACLAAILAGSALSYVLADVGRLAVASAIAFGASELLDLLVYERLHKKSWLSAVAVSNLFGLVLDSALFLWLAFGSLDFIEGQILGKFYMTLLAIIMLGVARALLSRYSQSKLARDGQVPALRIEKETLPEKNLP